MVTAGPRGTCSPKQTPQGFAHERWTQNDDPGDVVPALVTAVGRPPAAVGIKVRVGRYQADLTRESFSEWPRPPSPAVRRRRSDRGRSRSTKARGRPATGTRADAAGRGARRHRQPHRPDSRDGRRGASAGASSTARRRPTGSSDPRSSRSSRYRPRPDPGDAHRGSASQLPGGQRRPLSRRSTTTSSGA